MTNATRILVVVDMQDDFISGALGTPEARAIVEPVAQKITDFEGEVIYTLDTHDERYPETQEGRFLPIPHCIKGSKGWKNPDPIADALAARQAVAIEKTTFGSTSLAHHLARANACTPIESIELVGVCTDICIVSNALLLKASLPETPITVDAKLCAGSTPAHHEAALTTLACSQVIVKR